MADAMDFPEDGGGKRITVAICTRNRAEQLGSVLLSAAAMRVPAGLDWEMLIVDNGSTDHTPAMIDGFADRLPIRRVAEPVAGLSNARNRAVAEAAGAYICWTDDDVEIDPGWLTAYAEAFDLHPDAAYFGGVIAPRLTGSPPAWLDSARAYLGPMLAERRLGAEPFLLDPATGKVPFGANYAIRMREQRRHLYDPRLGRAPDQYTLGEETLVMEEIARTGGSGWWVPGATVHHIIPAERQTLQYVREYHYFAGATAAFKTDAGLQKSRLLPNSTRRVRGAPFYLWRQAAGYWLLERWRRPRGTSVERIAAIGWHSFYKGALDYWRMKNAGPG